MKYIILFVLFFSLLTYAAPKEIERIELGAESVSETIVLSSAGKTRAGAGVQVTELQDGFQVQVRISELRKNATLAEGEWFATLDVEGWGLLQTVGAPSVPVRRIMRVIPKGVTPRITISDLHEVQLDPVGIIPAQPAPMDVSPEPPPLPFQKDDRIYKESALYPAQRIIQTRIGQLRNTRILTIDVTPVQVNPVKREAMVADSFCINVSYDTKKKSDDEILTDGVSDGALPIYMILANGAYTNNAMLNTFADWKRRKGYDVRLVSTSEIDPGGCPDNDQIVGYMRGLPAVEYPEFLLIAGDHTATNGVAGKFMTTGMGGYTDLDISCRTAADYYPDLYCGRLPAVNGTNLTTMLEKVYAMDRDLTSMPMFQNVCVAGQIQDSNDNNDIADRLFCETADSVASYFEQDAGGVDYDCTRAVVNPDGVTSACEWNSGSILWNAGDQIGTRVHDHFMSETDARNCIIDQVNQGVSILQHRDHGYSNGVGWADPKFITSNVYDNLTNGMQRPVIFSINCNSGAYHKDNNFTRAWLQHPNGGAYAVFAPVDTSYSWHNDWLTQGFFSAFLPDYLTWHNASTEPNWTKDLPLPGGSYGMAGQSTRLGEILNFGKMYYNENFSETEATFKLFHLFGDPESYIQYLDPVPQTVTHSATVQIGKPLDVDCGVAGARVALYSEELGVHALQLTGTNGVASFTVHSAGTGTVSVTVTRFGAIPYEDDVEVSGSSISWSSVNPFVKEGDGSRQLSVHRSGDIETTVQIEYQTQDGTAEAGQDYVAGHGVLTFDPGVISRTIDIMSLDDSDDEGYESFEVSLFNPSSNAGTYGATNLTVTIEDNDGPGQLQFVSPQVFAGEGDGSVTVWVERVNGAEGMVAAIAKTADGTACQGEDYMKNESIVLFADSQISAEYVVDILDDRVEEGDQTVDLSLSSPAGGASLAGVTNAVLTINDDDQNGRVGFESDRYCSIETNGVITLALVRTDGSDGSINVDYATRNGTASNGVDYTATSGTLVFGHAETSKTFNVTLLNDESIESPNSFYVDLGISSQFAGSITTAQVVVFSEDGCIYQELMDSDPEWTAEGDWAFGVPTGQGGVLGYPDPLSGFTGTNVYGYNLNGEYPNSMDQTLYLTMPPLDCSRYGEIQLGFYRWLGVEEPHYDHASIDVSTDGITWLPVWENEKTITDSAWTWQRYTLPEIAEGASNVLVRFGMGASDGAWNFCGWNIDDVQITATELDDLRVLPRDTFCSRVNGGLILPELNSLSVSNCGPVTLDWSAALSEDWLSLTETHGTLDAGATFETSLMFNDAADLLGVATHTNWLSVSNHLSGATIRRAIVLDVQPLTPSNLLRNGDFSMVGTNENTACYWVKGEPDDQGGILGSASRESWRNYPPGTGANSLATIQGTWAGDYDKGSWWQDASSTPGYTYRLSGWFMADRDWSSDFQILALCFFDASTNVIGTAYNSLTSLTENFSYQEVVAVAPENTVGMQALVFAAEPGASGSLQFDSLELVKVPRCFWEVRSAHGTPDAAVGVHIDDLKTTLTNSVDARVLTNGFEMVCTGWTCEGNDPIQGDTNEMVLTLTNNAVVTWLWETNIPSMFVSILTPPEGWLHTEGVPLAFSGCAIDRDEEALAGTNLQWSSDIDGILGNGLCCTSSLSASTHEIMLTAFSNYGSSFTNCAVSINIEADENANQIADWWETEYFGGGSDSLDDADHDGLSNYQEWLAGTDPTNAASWFAINSWLEPGGTNHVVQWDGVPNRYYSVWYSTNICQPFIHFATLRSDTSGSHSITDTVHSAEQYLYYRMQVTE